MAWLKQEERHFLDAAARLIYCNPFMPEWAGLERTLLGDAFVDEGPVWSRTDQKPGRRENLRRIEARLGQTAENLRTRLLRGSKASSTDRQQYEDLVLLLLYQRHSDSLLELAQRNLLEPKAALRAPFYADFQDQARHYLQPTGGSELLLDELPHVFACFYQIRRAFHHIFSFIVGPSLPAARLRAAAWQSVFTHDMRRYRRGVFRHMGEVTTLVTGPSGSGKELVARAIGLSRYQAFDARSRSFPAAPSGSFHALDLSALSPTLIESELFGHRKGAFTGAQTDHAGWLETCPRDGAVFLDEIGELAGSIQVKLLRVLETRSFQRLGETTSRPFLGKVIVATNRNLEEEIHGGRFRADLYYRLCSDIITTPSLRERLTEAPEELHHLVLYLARQAAGPEEAEGLANEVEAFIHQHLGPHYAWPGNIRELSQCVRNIMVRKDYRPASTRVVSDSWEHLLQAAATGGVTAEEWLDAYVARVHAQTQNLEETARRLGLDRRTVKTRLQRQATRMG